MNRLPLFRGVLAIAGTVLVLNASANPPARSEEAILASRIGDQTEVLLKRGFHSVSDEEATTAFYAIDLEQGTRESDGQGEFIREVTRLLHCEAQNVNIVRSTESEMVLDFHFTPDGLGAEESLVRLTAFRIARKGGDDFWKLSVSGSGVVYEPFTERLEQAITSQGNDSNSLAAAHWTSYGMAEDLSSLAGITVQKGNTAPASCGDVYQLRWHDHGKYERIVLDLAAFNGDSAPDQIEELAVPGTYRVDYEKYPCRVVFDLVARGFSASANLPNLAEESALIQDLHRIPALDDSTVMFALTLKGPAEIEVFDLHGPARIVVDVRAARDDSADASEVKYSLRSPAHEAGETIGSLEEQLTELKPRNLRVLKTPAGEFCVEEGLYDTPEEAGRRAKALGRLGVALAVEKRSLLDAPGNGVTEVEGESAE